MSDQTLKLEIKINYPLFLGSSLVVHFLFLVFATTILNSPSIDLGDSPIKHQPINVKIDQESFKHVPKIGVKDAKTEHYLHSVPQKNKHAFEDSKPKKLNLKDLMVPQSAAQPMPKIARPTPTPTRPGTLPVQKSALSAVRYGSDDFKKLAQEPMLQGGGDLVSNDRVALNFELSKGQNENDLNDSQLKLYGFLRRGAMKYMNSLYSEIKDFELQNPHLQFPLVDTKQTLTGRLVYDQSGNLKQIKMVRWSNNDKLQGFFENVLKRLENLQNPPKELWVDNGEFVIFVTLQING